MKIYRLVYLLEMNDHWRRVSSYYEDQRAAKRREDEVRKLGGAIVITEEIDVQEAGCRTSSKE